MGKFTHYLVTRFNVPNEAWSKDKYGHRVLDDAWMSNRIHLFSTFCVPSVRNQANQNFKWIIYFDLSTPEPTRKIISGILHDLDNASLRFVNSMSGMQNDLEGLLLQSQTPFVITTRLDNDDVISRDFITTVQQHFDATDKNIINLEGGYFYDPRNLVLTSMRIPVCNNFISLIESPGSHHLYTVFGFPHTQIPGDIKINGVKEGMYWIRMVHDRNIRSELKGRPELVVPKYLLKSFAFQVRISIVNTMWYMFRRMLAR
jgi:hypothetical protein